MADGLRLTLAEARMACARAEADLRHGRAGHEALAAELEASLPESERDLANIIADTLHHDGPMRQGDWVGVVEDGTVVATGRTAERLRQYAGVARG